MTDTTQPLITTADDELEARRAKFWGDGKPSKPYPNFPLTITDRGYVKKVKRKGTIHIAGKVLPDEAIERWYAVAPDVTKGKAPPKRPPAGRVLLLTLVDRYLDMRRKAVEGATLTPNTYRQERRILRIMIAKFGNDMLAGREQPENFSDLRQRLAKFSPGTQKKAKVIIKAFYAHAFTAGWIERPPRMSTDFLKMGKKMSAGNVDDTADEEDKPTYSAERCRTILAYLAHKYRSLQKAGRNPLATLQMLTVTMLALNGGYGSGEASQLRWKRVHLDESPPMIRQKRRKTGARHRCVLWPETAALLALVKDARAHMEDDRVFTTVQGRPLVYEKLVYNDAGKAVSSFRNDAIFLMWRKMLLAMKVPEEERLGFYALKHTHRSASGSAGNEPAADLLCGHNLPGMRKVYEKVKRSEIAAVAEHVRQWLRPHRLGLPPGRAVRSQSLKSEGVETNCWPAASPRNRGRAGGGATDRPPSSPVASSSGSTAPRSKPKFADSGRTRSVG